MAGFIEHANPLVLLRLLLPALSAAVSAVDTLIGRDSRPQVHAGKRSGLFDNEIERRMRFSSADAPSNTDSQRDKGIERD